ncbi:MAG: STAS domain-containing protein [Oscillochloris sp.]|nr:STAS domain-containing protein [Oscillochloris sp.]
MIDQQHRITLRTQALCLVESGVLGLALIIGLLAVPEIRLLIILMSGIGLATAGITFWLRYSRFIEAAIYINIIVMLALLGLIDPLSGTLSGATWILFQIWPLIGSLVLRRSRATILLLVADLITLTSVATLQITGVIPVQLTVPAEILWFNLSLQIVMMVAISSISSLITHQEQQAYTTMLQLTTEREQQLNANQRLLTQQEALNHDLQASLAQIQQRDKQLREEQSLRADLMRTVDALAAPLIPISDDVVIAPLVGSFNQARLNVLTSDLLDQVGHRQVRVLILDLTGLITFDTATAQSLLATVESCRLMGTRTMLIGVQPEIAQTIVGLGIDLQHMITRSTLQEAIRFATRAERVS